MSHPVHSERLSPFHTPFGRMAIVWGCYGPTPRVHRILLPKTDRHGHLDPSFNLPSGTCQAISTLSMDIVAFLSGCPIEFDLSLVRLDLCTPFQKRVLLAEARIPRGRVSTYSRIARHLRRPLASRAVGNALGHNPFPIVIPCHRALRSDLSLGGYQGGLKMKQKLLEMEGVRFGPNSRARDALLHY